jgi:hypothetical protein
MIGFKGDCGKTKFHCEYFSLTLTPLKLLLKAYSLLKLPNCSKALEEFLVFYVKNNELVTGNLVLFAVWLIFLTIN